MTVIRKNGYRQIWIKCKALNISIPESGFKNTDPKKATQNSRSNFRTHDKRCKAAFRMLLSKAFANCIQARMLQLCFSLACCQCMQAIIFEMIFILSRNYNNATAIISN